MLTWHAVTRIVDRALRDRNCCAATASLTGHPVTGSCITAGSELNCWKRTYLLRRFLPRSVSSTLTWLYGFPSSIFKCMINRVSKFGIADSITGMIGSARPVSINEFNCCRMIDRDCESLDNKKWTHNQDSA